MQLKVVYIYMVPCCCLEFAYCKIKKSSQNIKLIDPGVETEPLALIIWQSILSTPLLTFPSI